VKVVVFSAPDERLRPTSPGAATVESGVAAARSLPLASVPDDRSRL